MNRNIFTKRILARKNKIMTTGNKQNSGSEIEKKEYLYTSAGIREREGHIPRWLIWLAVALLIWSTYYLFSYWSPQMCC